MKITSQYNLSEVNPKLAQEWHPTKNGVLNPESVTPRCKRKVWWQCDNGHEWKAEVGNRFMGTSCPYCAGKLATQETSLAAQNPELVKEWHPKKNGYFLPDKFTPGSHKKVWWICSKDKRHEWQTMILHRARKKSGCPFCSGHKASPTDNFKIYAPALAEEFDYERNYPLVPEKIRPNSAKKVWWICQKNKNEHRWLATVASRFGGNGCPYCSGRRVCESNSLQKLRPDLAKQWHPTKNGTLTPTDVVAGGHKKVWWQCSYGHEWQAPVKNRMNQTSICPKCKRVRTPLPGTSFQDTHKKLAQEWHPSKNGKLTPQEVTSRSNKKVWWQCGRNHAWQAMVRSRSMGVGCPYCEGRKACKDNCLATQNSNLAKEWHPFKNGNLTPQDVTSGSSSRKVWWQCEKGHAWEMKPLARLHGAGCPFCAGKRASIDNCLATVNPKLAKEWHPTKNGVLTPDDVTPGSGRMFWWLCEKGHEWDMRILARSHGSSCPYCNGRRVGKDNCLAIVNPKLAKEWHPTKNGDLTAADVTPGSKKKVWWVCKKGHEWEAPIGARNRGNGCVYCNSSTSMMELRIYAEFKTIFPDVQLRKKIDKIECDIYVTSLKVGVEYDGVYWHKNKYKNDRAKNVALKNKGIELIRVREVGLDTLSENDVVFDYRKKKDKQLVDALLKKIERLSILSSFDQERVDLYLKRFGLANNDEFINLLNMLPAPLPGTSLADRNPKIAKEWHPSKNCKLTPQDVTLHSSKKVWWQCERGHEWRGVISNRNRWPGCPYCDGRKAHRDNCLEVVNPKLAKEWHPTKNGELTPQDVIPGTGKKVWWICDNGHEWESSVKSRNNGNGCTYCCGKKVSKDNCLSTKNPKLANEWHPSKNGKLTPRDVIPGTQKKVWWICEKGHEWEGAVKNRSIGTGCPYCAGQRVCEDNCLATLNPKLAREWHPTKNGNITPNDVVLGSGRKFWWRCKKGHDWQAVLANRSFRGAGCPFCSGHRATEDNCLAAVNPVLAEEWHPTKNGSLTPTNVSFGSDKKVWWQCSRGHEWEAIVGERNRRGGGCPKCRTNRAKHTRLRKTKRPGQFEFTAFSELDNIDNKALTS